MKIVFLTRSLGYGGAERQLVMLARGLSARGHEVIVVSMYADGALEPVLLSAGVSVQSLGKSGRWDMFAFFSRLASLVKEEQPDVLHGYLVVPNILTVLVKRFAPRTRMVWGIRGSTKDLSQYDWLVRATIRLGRFLSRVPDLIVSNSEAGRADHIAIGYPVERMVVIPNGIDTERFVPDQATGRLVRAEWKIADDEQLIGLVGRLDPQKDHPTFLRAAAMVAKQRPHVRFVCVGTGPGTYAQQLKGLGRDLGLGSRLIWADARPDVTSVYNALDVLCLSSAFGEGFPNVLAEAMACGIPCIATDIGDSARIIGPFGRAVPHSDPQALCDGIMRMLETVKTMGSQRDAMRFHIEDNFSIRSLVGRTDATLQALCRGDAQCNGRAGADSQAHRSVEHT